MYKSTEFNPHAVERIKRKNSLVEMVYQAITESIASGSIQPGQRLRQEEIAEALHVSPRTVREAFKQLEADGLVAGEPYKGVRVAQMTLQDQIELFEMRLFLEGRAIELAAKNLLDSDLEKLQSILPETAIGDNLASIAQVRLMNREFHLIPVRASGLQQYSLVLERTWDLIITFFREWEGNWQYLQESGKEEDLRAHTEILAALEERNGVLARQKLEEHIRNYLNILYNLRDGSKNII